MGTMEKAERGIYRITNKDGSVSWMIDYLNPDKKRIRKTFSTRKEAVNERAKRIALIADGEYAKFVEKKKKPNNHTMKELIKSYKEAVKDESSFKSVKQFFLTHIEEYFGEDTLIASVDYQDLAKFKAWLKEEPTKHDKKRKISSVNREMSCLRQMFKFATGKDKDHPIEKKMLSKTPFDGGPSLHESKGKNKRKNFLLEDQLHKLLAELPKHAYQCTICAVLTGLDWKDIQNLRESQVHGGFIYGLRNKTGEEYAITVHPELQKIFDGQEASRQESTNVFDIKSGKKKRQSKTEPDPIIFTWHGKKIGSIKTAFKSACKEAGIPYGRDVPGGITIKDLRHTFASHFLMNGGTLEELQELMAHSHIATTKRYAHITQQHKRKVLLQMSGLIKADNESDSEDNVSSCQLQANSE
jgi:integrase